MRIDHNGRAGKVMVAVDVWRDLSLLGRITDSSSESIWHCRGEVRFVGQEGWWALCPSVLREGKEQQNKQAGNPDSN